MEGTYKARYPLPVKIAGLGRYLPERVVTNEEIEQRCGLPDGWCQRKQGIRERRWAKDESLQYMGAAAAREAAEAAGVALADVDLIVNASQTAEMALPHGGALLQHELGLGDSGIPCISVTSACLSFLTAIDLCAGAVAMGRLRAVLVVSAEIMSAKLDFSNAAFSTMAGDAAGAAVLVRTPECEKSGINATLMETYSEASGASCVTGGARRTTYFSAAAAAGEAVFAFDAQHMQSASMKYHQRFLSKLWSPSARGAISLVIPNQSSRLALDMMKFTFSPRTIAGIIDRFGNTGAAGYPLALYEAVQEKRITRGDLVLMSGMGAGLSIYGTVITY